MSEAVVRPYRPSDHNACRRLWAELAEDHRALYVSPSHAGADPGDTFEEYLTRLDLTGMWVADHPGDGVVGLVGLLLRGHAGEVEPVVVAGPHRGQGIGTALLAHVAQQARRRGLWHLTVTPASRNVTAIRCLHAAGYQVLSGVELTLDLSAHSPDRRTGLDLHDLRFSY